MHTALFSARVVTVPGSHPHTTTAAVVAAARLGAHPPLISVDPGATAARVEALPYIASARVERHWPDGVTIAVTERVPVAVMAGPGAAWSVLDGDGRTLQVAPARPSGLLALDGDHAGRARGARGGGPLAAGGRRRRTDRLPHAAAGVRRPGGVGDGGGGGDGEPGALVGHHRPARHR